MRASGAALRRVHDAASDEGAGDGLQRKQDIPARFIRLRVSTGRSLRSRPRASPGRLRTPISASSTDNESTAGNRPGWCERDMLQLLESDGSSLVTAGTPPAPPFSPPEAPPAPTFTALPAVPPRPELPPPAPAPLPPAPPAAPLLPALPPLPAAPPLPALPPLPAEPLPALP